jgi:Holliday junction resolvase RusA-like endonuclease
MSHIFHRILGVPYGKGKTRGNTDAAKEWTRVVVEQTKHLPKVKETCILKVTFLLPPNKFPKDLSYGPDLDNLMKRLSDSLNETIFSETEGRDSCIIELNVKKTRVESESDAGVLLEVLPIKI